jgi:hypothetical protein
MQVCYFAFSNDFCFVCQGSSSLVTVNADASFSATSLSFVYNVLASGNIRLISTASITSNVTITNCTFSVNGSGAVVPVSFIGHYGGCITIQQSSFTDLPLSAQALISFLGLFAFQALFFLGVSSVSDGVVNPFMLNIVDTNFTRVESRGNFAAVIQTGVAKV